MGLLACLAALCLALTWAGGMELQREGRTRNHGHSVCSTWGDFRYKTFDGDVFRFPGLCDYNLASDCRDAYKEFAVHLKRSPGSSGGLSQVEYILLTVKDDAIYLTRQLAVLNGAMVSTPHYSPGLLIEKTDTYTKVYSRAGLTLMWNQEDSVMLELDSKFRNHTCGLCGDYNGLQTYSEFLSEGVPFSPVEFGNMQKVNKPEVVCDDPEETVVPESCSEHRAQCERLLTAAAFASCQGLVPVELYVQACTQDRCQCPQNASCVCSTIAEFSRQCSHAGGRPENWRTDAFCPKSCPGNMVYLESGSPCMDTCSHLEVSNLCEEHHMDGCFCPEGTVYDDIAGGGCIPVSQCGCKLHGHLYTPGQETTNNCKQCVCNAGHWVCQDLQCPGTCSLEGGAHISTFDGRKYTFHGDCYYVLTKTQNDSYALLSELAPCGSTDKQTCLKTVVLLADSKKNVVTFRSDGSVLLNELKVNLPHVTASFSIFQPTSYHLIVTTTFGLKLQIQLVPVMQLFLTLDQAAQGRVQGLCGNFNGLEGDDFKTAGGLVEATGAGFANTWKVQASCQDKQDWLDDPCSLNIESANYAEHWCSLLKKTETPFERCHSAVDPAEYYKRCKYDTCNCQNTEDCMCAALSSYARACATKGVMLWGWRERVCNKGLDSCPKSQVFLYNLTTCQQTCRSLSESDTHCLQGFAPVDGCGCPDHMFLDEKGRCVPLAKCSCYYRGLYLEAGEVVLRQEERCVCRNGRLSCIQVKLIGQACKAPKIHIDCNNVTALAIRNPRPVSCQTLAAGYYQTECISGCVCPEGLIDDGRGGCVVEEACPCVHNNDLYSPGDKITVDCNTCTCQKGRWACTQLVCHGTCTIYGSGHYITFDGKYYDFDGHCSYVALQDYCGQNTSLGSFSILTENVPCGTTGVTCSKAIKIFIGRTVLKLEDRHCMVIQRDVGDHVAYIMRDVGQYLVVEASIGVIVIWDRKTTIFIKLTPSYKGTVCGLCGNFDQQSNNDFTTRDSMVVDSELDFGNSWKEASTCPDVTTTPEPCAVNLHRRSWSEKQCSIIKSRVFQLCHSKVDPMPFYEACVQDSCSCDTGGDCECFCSAVASYAQQCTKEGACVYWRTPDLCPIFCDYYNPPNECEWHYEPCGNRSFETCRTVNGIHSNISISYLEGCYPRCPRHSPIYDEELKACVTRDQCGCYINNTRYTPGTSVPTGHICHSCMCTDSSTVVCWVDEGRIVNSTQDGSFCYWEFCGPNGTVQQHFNVCVSHSTPITTTPPTTTSTTTSITPTSSTVACCSWSDWINNDYPSADSDGGDRERFDGVCRAPQDIECRAAVEPLLSWETLGQKARLTTTPITTTETTTPTTTTETTTPTTTTGTTTPTTTTETTTPTTATGTTTPTTITTTETPTPTPTTTVTPGPSFTTTTTETPIPTQSPTTTETPATTPSMASTGTPMPTSSTTSRETRTTTPTSTVTPSPTTTTAETSTPTPTTTETTTPSTTTETTTPTTTTETTTPKTPSTTRETTTPITTTTTVTPTPTPSTSESTTPITSTETTTPTTTTTTGTPRPPSTTTTTEIPTPTPTTTVTPSPPSPTTTTTTIFPSTPTTLPSTVTAPGITATPTRETTTTPATTTSTTEGTTTVIPTSPCLPECRWTGWLDSGKPNDTKAEGDVESLENICARGWVANISCRAADYPKVPLQELEQTVVCDTSVGLVCKNQDQKSWGATSTPACLNYEIDVYCCFVPPFCVTTPSTTSTETPGSSSTTPSSETSGPTTTETPATTPSMSSTGTPMPTSSTTSRETRTTTPTTTVTSSPTTTTAETSTPTPTTTETTTPSTTTETTTPTTTTETTTPSTATETTTPTTTTETTTPSTTTETTTPITTTETPSTTTETTTPITATETTTRRTTTEITTPTTTTETTTPTTTTETPSTTTETTTPSTITETTTPSTTTETTTPTTATETTTPITTTETTTPITTTETPSTTTETTTPTTTTETTTPTTTTETITPTTTTETTTPTTTTETPSTTRETTTPITTTTTVTPTPTPSTSESTTPITSTETTTPTTTTTTGTPRPPSTTTTETPTPTPSTSETTTPTTTTTTGTPRPPSTTTTETPPPTPTTTETTTPTTTTTNVTPTPTPSTSESTTPITSTETTTTTTTGTPRPPSTTTRETPTPTPTPSESTPPSTTTTTGTPRPLSTTTTTEIPTPTPTTTVTPSPPSPTTTTTTVYPSTPTTLPSTVTAPGITATPTWETTTTPATTTSTTEGTTTVIPTSPCLPECRWTGWLDSGKPNDSRAGGDVESLENICARGWVANISCRAADYPKVPLQELEQTVVCDTSVGLVCKNQDQKSWGATSTPACLNYEIDVYCCFVPPFCVTTPSTTTTETPGSSSTTPSSETSGPTTTETPATTPSMASTGTPMPTSSTTSRETRTTTPTTTVTSSPTTTTAETSTPTPTTTEITTPTTTTETTTPTTTTETTTPTTATETTTPSTTTETTTPITTTETTTPITTTETTTPSTTTETTTPTTTTETTTPRTTTETTTPSTTTETTTLTTTTETTTPTTTTETTTPSTTTETTTPTTTTETTTPRTTTETTTPSTTTETTTLTTTTETTTPSTTTETTTLTTTTETTTPSTTTETTTLTTTTETTTPTTATETTTPTTTTETTTPSGDVESLENICVRGWVANISCRAADYPKVPLQELEQTVVCDTSVGLVCKNQDQKSWGATSTPACLNYEIDVYCCFVPPFCVTTPSTTTMETQTTTLTVTVTPSQPSTTTSTETPTTIPTITSTGIPTPASTTTTTETPPPTPTTSQTTTPTTTTTTETPRPPSTTTTTETPPPTPTTTETTTPTTTTTTGTPTPTPTTTVIPGPPSTTTTTTETPTPTPTPSESTTPSTTTTTGTPRPPSTTTTTTETPTPTPTPSESTTPSTTTTTGTPRPPSTTTTTTGTPTPTPTPSESTTPTTTTTTETPAPAPTSTVTPVWPSTTTTAVETSSTPLTLTLTVPTVTPVGGTTLQGWPTPGPTSSKTTPTPGSTTGSPLPSTGPASSPTATPASATSTGAPTSTGRPSATPESTSTWTSSVSTSTVTPATSPHITTSTGGITSNSITSCCSLNDTYYAPGELVYNGTHGDTCYYVNCSLKCELEFFNWSCPSTSSPTPSPSTTTTHESSTPNPLVPGCPDLDPPREENESWWICNCTKAICKYNNTVELVKVKCEPPPMPTCSNGLTPVRVEDSDKCCWHWECDCYCTGWGDPHYVTFDGLYYSYQGNCTYVLVEEISPKVDNFGIYVDNYHCDVNDEVSCPRTLIVRHETQEVLIKTVQMMPIRVQVQVNRQAVALPYTKFGLQVYESGINYMVDIPELGALISYNGLSFSIRLPYRLFGNNTKGQCGTCTNNTLDDCVLPSGESIGSCEVAADYWVVNDPSKPRCPHSSFTTRRPAISPSVGTSSSPMKSCVSPLCELIKDSLFAQCHALAPPQHYYEACLFDSCYVPGSNLECASLQTYAALCAQEGICVDWRNHTGGACPVTCPAHREYRACGPVEEPTCKSRSVMPNSTRLVEGCFCPEGTTSYAPGFDVCVDLCGCVGPDNVPREYGEHFEFDCKDCICLEGGSGIICKPKTCRPEPRLECEEDGTYAFTEVDPTNTCCNLTSCKCNASLCREKPLLCPLGFQVKSEMVPGRCCPLYSCVPKGVCVLEHAEYQPGSPVYSSKCQNCVCTDRRDDATQLNVITCSHVPCNTTCSPGFELVDAPGECCKKCEQTHCIISLPGQQSLVLKPGDMKSDSLNNCTFFSCVKIHDQLISSVSNITCPDFDPSTCVQGSITLMPNGCCRKCVLRNETSVPCATVPVVREISHNGCTTLVSMNDCSGSCGTFAMYSAEAQALDHRCSCCKEHRTSQREVTLQCPDGGTLRHTYTHIDSCLCQDTLCEPPAQRRARRSSPLGVALGRG
ncbi:unnamed protein product [Rangifer tarandus platyrhynchus]|uniref:Mucin-2 n=1 Tax=Rangifer tarandus platyrhynchus TaxID=3082113 RepID=A0ABN8Z0P3_RANTA|nr:unnamed protein product [Rangifer tarandus platyrhynchus]